MNLQGTCELHASRAQVWEALNDPDVLGQCTPGCKELRASEGGSSEGGSPEGSSYDVLIEVGIAAVKGRYDGKIKISDRVPGSQYRLAVSGTGRTGFLRAEGTIRLADSEAGTLLEYSGEAHVGGPIAGVGQRIMQGVAKQIVGQFFKSLEKAIEERSPREPTAG